MTNFPTQDQQGPWGDQLVAAITERIAVPQATANAAQTDATQALADAASAQAAAGDAQSDATQALSDAAAASTAAGGKLAKSSNLSDLTNPGTARTNLGLGGAAVLSVGTTTGTVAAGNDSRFTRPRAVFLRSAAQTYTTGAAAAFNWSSVTTKDGGPTYPGGPIAELPAFNGDWSMKATAVFESAAGGMCYFRLFRASDDALVLEGSAAADGGEVIVTAAGDYYGSASDSFYTLAEQNSGGDLDLLRATLSISLLART